MENNIPQAAAKDAHVAVVLVFYNPSESDIQNARTLSSVYGGVIIDNSDKPFTDETMIGRMRYVCNHKNLGIAEAQNIGIKHILELGGYRHIVFLDQDSRLSASYPQDITSEFIHISSTVTNLASLGPTVSNKDTGEEYRSAIHTYQTDENGFSQRRHIISSGSCIPTKILRDVGFMDGGMFIDYVDYEWCWRAASKGYVCGITSKIHINHKVGKKELHIGNYKIIISAPFRYYYQYRNYFWLIRKKYVPLQWKIATGIKFSLRLVYFPLIVDGGTECWKFIIKGIKHGVRQENRRIDCIVQP